MKAVTINQFGAPDVLQIEELPTPVPNKNQVLVKVYAASINPIDFKSRQGNHKYILGSNFPIVLGYDFAGEIIETGAHVKQFKVGDRVHGRSDVKYGGTYAQFALSSESVLTAIPSNMGYEEAAAIPLASLTALQALRDKANIKKGDKILLTGATGGVGHFALQIAKYYGAFVIAINSSRHIEYIKELEPDLFIDYNHEDFKNLKEKYDIVFDAAGKVSFLSCKHLVRKGATFITLLPRPKLLIHGIVSKLTGKKLKTFIMKSNSSDLQFMDKLIEEKHVKVKIDKIFSMDQISEAHTYAEQGHTEGKIVIKIDHGR